MWGGEDIRFAQCLWMSHDEPSETITADLRVTYLKAINLFIEHCYPAFWTQPQFRDSREALKHDLEAAYMRIAVGCVAIHRQRLPWYDKFKQHQQQGLIAGHYRKVNFNSLDPRLGKTILCASQSIVHNIERTLVVTYSVGKWNWMNDIVDPKWGGDSVVSKLNFTIYDANRSRNLYAFDERFIIVNYESLGKYIPAIMDAHVPIGHIILSEAQKVKNHQTSAWKNVHKLYSQCPDARLTFETGTPVMNRINDLYAYFRLGGHPLGENYVDFKREYVETDQRHGNVVASRNIPDMQKRMSNFIFRKTRKECTDMPDHNYINLYFQLGDWEKEYKKAIYELIKAKGKFNIDSAIQSINRIMALAKVPGIIELTEQLIDAGEKVVIFFGFTDPIRKVVDHFGKAATYIDGSLDAVEKVRRAIMFQENPDVKMIAVNTKAGGHTIDLSVANVVVNGNYPLSPKEVEQAHSRVHNLMKTEVCDVYMCIATGGGKDKTVDQRLAELVGGKDSDINWLIDGKQDAGFQDNVGEMIYKELMEQYKDIVPDENVKYDSAGVLYEGAVVKMNSNTKFEDIFYIGQEVIITRIVRKGEMIHLIDDVYEPAEFDSYYTNIEGLENYFFGNEWFENGNDKDTGGLHSDHAQEHTHGAEHGGSLLPDTAEGQPA